MFIFFFLMLRLPPRSTRTDHSFPTRRSSDLKVWVRYGGGSVPNTWREVIPLGWAGTRFECLNILAVEKNVEQIYYLDLISGARSEEHTSELQSLMRISYAVF